MIIAVDGPAASGKGTVARRIARHYKLTYLDTGSLYRAVARDILLAGEELADPHAASRAARNVLPETLDDPQLRSQEIGRAASIVAGMDVVRQTLLTYQREIALVPPGAVLDGRDIGTIVCPDADAKLFVTASPQVRAKRRFDELKQASQDVNFEEILREIQDRDERDRTRGISPLVMAQDAHLLDTTNLDIETSYRTAVDLIDAALGQAARRNER